MRLGYLLVVCLGVALAGCGDSGRSTLDDGGSDAGGDDAGGDGGNDDAGGDDGGPGDGGSGMDAGTDGSTPDGGSDGGAGDAAVDAPGTDAMTDATITIGELSVYGNCMPSVAPDPIIAFWTASVSGASSSTATLVSAELTISGGGTTVNQTLTVDEPTIDLTGGSGSQMQRKEDAEGDSTGACGSLCTGASFELELTYEVDGATVTVTETGDYSCVH